MFTSCHWSIWTWNNNKWGTLSAYVADTGGRVDQEAKEEVTNWERATTSLRITLCNKAHHPKVPCKWVAIELFGVQQWIVGKSRLNSVAEISQPGTSATSIKWLVDINLHGSLLARLWNKGGLLKTSQFNRGSNKFFGAGFGLLFFCLPILFQVRFPGTSRRFPCKRHTM